MKRTGLDATNLARRAQLNPSTLTGFMSQKPRVHAIRRSTLDAIARVSKVPLPAELASPSAPVATAPGATTMPRDVPIHGLLAAPVIGAYYWNQSVADFAPRPPGIAHSTRVFALRSPDEEMAGWRRVNELIYVDPLWVVAEGDHAFIELANINSPDAPSVYKIRRVVQRRPIGVVLGTWGLHPTEERLERTQVLSLYRVLEWPELLGI